MLQYLKSIHYGGFSHRHKSRPEETLTLGCSTLVRAGLSWVLSCKLGISRDTTRGGEDLQALVFGFKVDQAVKISVIDPELRWRTGDESSVMMVLKQLPRAGLIIKLQFENVVAFDRV